MEDKTVEMFEKIWSKIAELPTRDEVKALVEAKKATDWKSIAKFAAILIPTGGLGAAIAEIVRSFNG